MIVLAARWVRKAVALSAQNGKIAPRGDAADQWGLVMA
jgi:hypothetical protein